MNMLKQGQGNVLDSRVAEALNLYFSILAPRMIHIFLNIIVNFG